MQQINGNIAAGNGYENLILGINCQNGEEKAKW
jgi:hypothetical protein